MSGGGGYESGNIGQYSPSSSSSSASSSSSILHHQQQQQQQVSSLTSTLTQTNDYSSQAYVCIISDLTEASNTGRRHVINLSGSYSVEHLFREAANFFSYDPFSFKLMWKNGESVIDLSDFNDESIMLNDLGLNTYAKNIFEIHEKEGPPKKLKTDEYGASNFIGPKNSSLNEMGEDSMPQLEPSSYMSDRISTYPPRRNAGVDELLFSVPTDFSTSFSFGSSSYYNYDEEGKSEFVGLINQAMTCYLNSLLQTLFMTPEFRNAIYRYF